MKKRVLSIVLVLTMLLSMVPTSVFANTRVAEEPKDSNIIGNLDINNDGEINYVALGDSMTNGFGMGDYYLFMQRHEKEGHADDWSCTVCTADHQGNFEWEYHCPYSPVCNVCMVPAGEYPYIYDLWENNNWGYLANVSEAYPSLVANAIANETGKTVNQLNMAVSGFRAEELRFMLDNEYATNGYDGYTKKYYTAEPFTDAYTGETANGDNRTKNLYFNAISNPNTYVSPYAAELNAKVNTVQADGKEYFRQFQIDYPSTEVWDDEDMARIRAHYNIALDEAELITIALGTNNFGTGVQTSIYRAIEHHTGAALGDTIDYGYDLDALLEEFPNLKELYPSIEKKILEMFAETPMMKDMGFCDDCIKDIVRTYAYGILGFMANYEESLKLIREMNPDATIVVVGAMNMEEGLKFTLDGKTVDFGGIYDTLLSVGNAWLAGHVAEKDNVYYSEIDKPLDLIVNDMAEGAWNNFMVGHMAMDFAEPAQSDWWVSDKGYASDPGLNWLHARINKAPGIIRVVSTFGLHNEAVLQAVEAYNAGDETALDALAAQIVEKYAGETRFILWWNEAESVTTQHAINSMRLYAMSMEFLDALKMATKKDTINFDNVKDLLDKDGYMVIFEDLDRLDDEDVQDLLYFYARMKFANGAGVHPSVQGHQDIAEDIIKSLKAGRSGAEDAAQKMAELLAKIKPVAMTYLQNEYPSLYKALDVVSMDDLALIVTMLKLSKSEALEGVDLEALEAKVRGALKNFEESKTPEEQAAAQKDVRNLAYILWALGTKATGGKYEVTEDSYYVSFGDSNVNGIGLDGYKETNNNEDNNNGIGQYIEDAAPALLAKALFGEDWKERFAPYAQGGIRVEDVYYILGGEIEPDQYYNDMIVPILLKDTVEATRADYIAELQKADLISFVIGGGNVSTFVGYQIERVAAGAKPAEMNWANLGYTSETLQELKAFLETAVPLVDALGLMDKYVPAGLEIEEPAKFAAVLLESILYGYASYNYYYPLVLDQIREINPDAQLLLLGMFNPIDDWALTMEMAGKEKNINIGGIAANAMNSANLQSLVYALQNENTSFVDISETETFLDAEYANKKDELTFQVYYEAIMKNNGKLVHANVAGHKYIFEQMYAALSGEGCVDEVAALMAQLYTTLKDTYLTTEEKINFLGKAYATVKDKVALDKYPELAAIEEIYAYLKANGCINDQQTLDMILYVCDRVMDREVSEQETKEIAVYLYELLLSENSDIDDATKVAIIKKFYSVLKGSTYLAPYEKPLTVVEEIVKLPELQNVTATQIMTVVNMVYNAVIDGKVDNAEIREIAGYIYFEVLKTTDAVAVFSLNVDVTYIFSAAEKIAIIEAVYEVLEANGYIDTEAYPQLEPVKAIYVELTNAAEGEEPLISDETALGIFDIVFETFVEEETIDEDVIADLTVQISDKIIYSEDIAPEAKAEILEKVVDTLENSAMGGEVIPQLTILDELLAKLKEIGCLNNEQAGKIIEAAYPTLMKLNKGEEVSNEEMLATAAFVYNTLVFDNNKVAADIRAKGLAIVYDALKESGYLNPFADKLVIVDAFRAALTPYVTCEQFVAITNYVYQQVTAGTINTMDIANYIYAILLSENSDNDAETKFAIIEAAYGVLKGSAYLAPYEKPLAVAESIIALPELENVTAEQIMDIVNKVYNAVIDGDVSNAEIRAIIGYIYFDVLKTEESAAKFRLFRRNTPHIFSAAEKIAIIEAVYGVLETNGYIDSIAYPELSAVKALYDELTADENPLISDEKALEIFDLVVAALVEEETIDDAVITDLALQISDKIIADGNIEPAAKVEILKKVVATMKACNLGGEFTPYLDVVGALREALKAANYMTDAQAGEIIEAIYPVLPLLVKGEELTEDLIAAIAKEVFIIVFEQPELTIQDKFSIVVIIYDVMDEYGYVDMAITMALTMGYAMAKENGYVDQAIGYIDIAIQTVDSVKNAVAGFAVSNELAGVKAALLTEINATVETLEAIKALLKSDVLANMDDAWTAILNLQTEMNQHINNITTLAMEIGFAADYYVADCVTLFDALSKLVVNLDPAMSAAIMDSISQLQDAVTDVFASALGIESQNKAEIEALKAQLAQQMQILSDKMAELENATGEEAKEIIRLEIDRINNSITQIQAYIAQNEQQLIEIGVKTSAVYDSVLGVGTAIGTMIDAGLKPGMAAMQAALDDVAKALVALAGTVDESLAAPTSKVLDNIKTMLNNVYKSNTTADYVINKDSYYVALGDADAYGQSAELLTQEMGLLHKYANLTESGLSASELLANIEAYAAEIAKADLVTLGFSANTFTAFTASQVKLAMYDRTPVEMDWAALIGEAGATNVAEALASTEAYFIEEGVPARYASVMTLAIESYVFAYVSHMVDYVQVTQAIHAINPEALLVLVGMYNPLDGVILDLGESQINLGQYVRYLVDATNVYTLGNAVVIPEAIYADAPAVEMVSPGTVIDVVNFIGELVYNPNALDAYAPTDAGYEYIKDQILATLNVEHGLLGDADSNGVVNNIDAMMILQYHTGIIEADRLDLTVCDVNNDGVVNNVDAMMVLQYHTGVITEFN